MVSKNVSIKKIKTPEGRPWRVRWSEQGKDCSRRFATRDEAEAKAAEIRDAKQSNKEVWHSLPAFERNNLIAAYGEAKRLGVDIHRAIITSSQQTPVVSMGIGKVIEELKASLLRNGRNKKYVNAAAVVWNQFARGKESMEINRFTLKDVEVFMDLKNLNYRQTIRGRLSTLFNFSVRRGYCLSNPCMNLEKITVVRPSPKIFTVEQIETAVKWLNEFAPHGLPWFALSTFCGLRPEEAEKTTKADIHFAEGFIRVEAQTTKVRQRRVVYPRPEAMAFLKRVLKKGSLPLSSGERRWILAGRPDRKTKGLRHALGFDQWPKDITRHTAASYWLASDGSAAHVSEMLGNSEKVLKSHYKALVTQKEAKEFWRAVAAMK